MRCHLQLLASAGRQMVITAVERALCRHTNFSRERGGGWAGGADLRKCRASTKTMNGGLLWAGRDCPAEQGRLVPRPGSFRLLPQIPITARAEAPQDENMCKTSSPTPSCPQVHKKSDVDGYRQANSGVPVTPPNWEAKYGGRTPLSGSLNKRPFWIFM